MVKDMLIIFSVLLFLTVLVQSIQTSNYESLEGQLDHINNQIISYKRMGFLNQNFNNISQHFPTFSEPNIFIHMKIRKFVTTKIDLGEEMRNLQKTLSKNNNQVPGMLKSFAKRRFIEDLNFISTVALPSKKFQGFNFNSHIILQSVNKFYSIEGQNIFTFPLGDIKEVSVSKSGKLMIASSRNENFYIAKYEEQHSVRYNADCLNVMISHVQIKNKQFSINMKQHFDNLRIETNACHKQDIREAHDYTPYEFFFTYNAKHNKPSHYILANTKQIHFYFYSEIAEQLVMDQNKTIRLAQIYDDKTQNISTIVKLKTHLIILTNKNHLFSVNLINYLSSKVNQSIIIYETVPLKFQKLQSIHFNDNDFRFFHVLSNRNIYLYKLSTLNIVKKYPLKAPICKQSLNLQKCTENIYILENYILVQEKEQRNQYNLGYQYFLIDKASGNWHSFHIPFSHESKCSHLKKIFITKNKNSHYIMTLACFMQQKVKNESQTGHKAHTQASNYLILQHLNLQTSSQMNNSGDIGGVDFTKFRVPMIVFSIGLVCYITLKRTNKKSPQKIAQEQKLNKKFQQQILSTIRRQKQRQQALNLHSKKG